MTLGASLYLSATTLTTVGFGDVVPLNGATRILSAFASRDGERQRRQTEPLMLG